MLNSRLSEKKNTTLKIYLKYLRVSINLFLENHIKEC